MDRRPVEVIGSEQVDKRLKQSRRPGGEDRGNGDDAIRALHLIDYLAQLGAGEAGEEHVGDRVGMLAQLDGGGFGREDRKSTRLNSSHVAISYAVFCLKKKITNSTRG